MTKSELIEIIAAKQKHLPAKDVELAVKQVLEIMSDALAGGERISLSVKQLAQDPFSNWIAQHPKGSIVRGIVREVEAKGAIVDLGGGIDGYLRASELTRDRVEDARTMLKVGDEVEAKFTAVDRKVRTVALSIKAKDMAEEHEAMQSYRSDSTTGTSLGDLLKEQISGQ